MTKKFVHQDSSALATRGNYSHVIAKIDQDGVCPFCPENVAKYHPNPILFEGKHWLLTKNAYPYKGAAHHFLLIHKTHAERFEDVLPAAWAELQTTVKKALSDNNITGAALVFRFGDAKFTGASVTHLHAQLISGGLGEPVLARVG